MPVPKIYRDSPRNRWLMTQDRGQPLFAFNDDGSITNKNGVTPDGRLSTYVIAASDTPARARVHADYKCDGVADNVQVFAAFDDGIAAGLPFKVIMLPGTYNFSDGIELNLAGFNHLVELDAYGAEITYSGGATTGVFYFKDNTLAGVWNPKDRLIIRGFHLTGNDSGTMGVYLRNMTNVLMEDLNITGFGSSNARAAIYITDTTGGQSEYTTIRRCNLWDNTIAIWFNSSNGGAASATVEDCILSAINVDNANVVLLNLSGGNVARSHFRNNVFHLGGAVGQIAVYINTNIDGSVFDVFGLDNHSTVNLILAFADGSSSNGTFDIIGYQTATSGGAITHFTLTSGSLTPRIRGGDTYITEKSGFVLVPSGSITAVASHTLSFTPTHGNIMVVPMDTMGTASKFWVGSFTSTQFTVGVNREPAVDINFAWQACQYR